MSRKIGGADIINSNVFHLILFQVLSSLILCVVPVVMTNHDESTTRLEVAGNTIYRDSRYLT